MWGIRGRQRDALSTYKRISRENLDADLEESAPALSHSHGKEAVNPSWMLSLPHVVVATMSSLLFGYHLGVVNDTLESIPIDLGFSGDTLSEVGSIFSGSIADGLGRRRAFQLTALPMIIGASMSAITKSLGGTLLGRFFVGIGMGIGPPVAALYVSEVSPAYLRGTFGSFTQIATCFGLMASFFIGIPAKETKG